MISKELLSEVLDIPLQHIRYNGTTNHYKIFKENLFNWNSGDYGRWSNLEINIYELAHKCKEWACKKGYSIISISDFDIRHDTIDNYDKYYFTAYINMNLFPELNKKEYTHLHDINSSTEPEAIFKACQWILDNKDIK